MFSEHANLRFPLRCVALVGGGRWSRVLLPVIHDLLDESSTILWVTEHGYDRARVWLQEKEIDRVVAVPQLDLDSRELVGIAIDAAIVATSPAAHAEQVRRLLELGIPTFCEKPFTLDFDEAEQLEQLAVARRCVLGIDLEMHFASFIEDFATRTSERVIHRIAIDWIDPWSETRYGETKHGDIYTGIVDDMWPHCWSLLRKLVVQQGTNERDMQRLVTSIDGVTYQPNHGEVGIDVSCGAVKVHVVLGRRGNRRMRRVDVNGGAAVLDFSAEPGSVVMDGVSTINEWRGARPLSRSLSSFFEVVFDPTRVANWPLAAQACLDSVRSAQAMSQRLRTLQEAMLKDLRHRGVELNQVGDRNLIVDFFLPQYAAEGNRIAAITEVDQLAFVRSVCESHKLRCH